MEWSGGQKPALPLPLHQEEKGKPGVAGGRQGQGGGRDKVAGLGGGWEASPHPSHPAHTDAGKALYYGVGLGLESSLQAPRPSTGRG